MSASSFWTKELLHELNQRLEKQSYICGDAEPSPGDSAAYASLFGAHEIRKYPHIKRWYFHIGSFPQSSNDNKKLLQEIVMSLGKVSYQLECFF